MTDEATVTNRPAHIGRNFRCLVVSDIEAMRVLTVNLLRQIGVDVVRVARTGKDALRVLQEHAFDAVLIEREFSDMTGLDLIKAVRAEPQLCSLPLILTLSVAVRAEVEAAVAAGVFSVLLKPYSSNQLLTALVRTQRPKRQAAAVPDAPKPDASTVPASARRAQAQGRASILVVDDTPENLSLLSELLKHDFHVRVATDGAKALQVVASKDPPDLVLLDVMMPNMDGFEVALRMRELPAGAAIPIIFVTGLTTDEARTKGLDLGAVDVITKPIDPPTLHLRVRNILRHMQHQRALQLEYDALVERARLHRQTEDIVEQDLRRPVEAMLGVVTGLVGSEGVQRQLADQLRLLEIGLRQLLGSVDVAADVRAIETAGKTADAQTIPMGEMIRSVAQDVRVQCAGRRLTVEVDGDMPVGTEVPCASGDPRWCLAALRSLVDALCGSAPAGCRVRIRLHDETPLRIEVRTQTELPEEAAAAFFDKDAAPVAPGSGMRPYIAKRLIEAQGGGITFEASGADVRLCMTLPRVPADPAAASLIIEEGRS